MMMGQNAKVTTEMLQELQQLADIARPKRARYENHAQYHARQSKYRAALQRYADLLIEDVRLLSTARVMKFDPDSRTIILSIPDSETMESWLKRMSVAANDNTETTEK